MQSSHTARQNVMTNRSALIEISAINIRADWWRSLQSFSSAEGTFVRSDGGRVSTEIIKGHFSRTRRTMMSMMAMIMMIWRWWHSPEVYSARRFVSCHHHHALVLSLRIILHRFSVRGDRSKDAEATEANTPLFVYTYDESIMYDVDGKK